LIGIKVKFSRVESERFVIDRTYHTWVYHVSTGLKVRDCKIQLPKGAEDVTVTNGEYSINLQPETFGFVLSKKKLPFFSSFEFHVSFVTRPRIDEVISYIDEKSEIVNSRYCIKSITVKNKQNYVIDRIRLERTIDFEPPIFKVEELTAEGAVKIITGLKETSKDTMGRITKSVLTWETNFSSRECKNFRVSYELPIEKENIPSTIIKSVTDANLLFNEVTSIEKIFRDSMLIADELHTICKSDRDFAHKIGVLCQLFDVPLQPLRELLKANVDENWQSIKLIEEWLKQEGISYDSLMIKTWKYIIGIRNKSPPFHQPDSRIITFCEFFDQSYPPNYSDFWICILSKFKKSIEEFVNVLAKMSQVKKKS